MSLSHVLGDGHTFYALHGMLSAALAGAAPLCAERKTAACVESRMVPATDRAPVFRVSLSNVKLFRGVLKVAQGLFRV